MKEYPLFKVHIPIEEALENIKNVFLSGFINEGEQVTQLTQKMQSVLETKNLILMNSCTSAITLALKLCGVSHKSKVVTTPMTCVATNTPIDTLGAEIVWCDIDSGNGMVDLVDLERKLFDLRCNIRAVIAVAWAGTPPNLKQLRKVCDNAQVPLILDAAHAFGARYKGQPIHEWADYTTYSFQAIKHVTTGDGGALICRNEGDYQRSKALKWFGLDRDKAKDKQGNWKGQQWDVDIAESGFKFNMNNVSAAIGLSQINHIDNIIGTHRKNAALYDELFLDCKTVNPAMRPKGSESSFWVYTMLVNPRSSISRDELLQKLNKEGIAAGVVHIPNDDYTAFEKYKTYLPGVRNFSSRQMCLPVGWWLSEDDIKHIAERVIELSK